jgi:hypothetical protein
VSTTPEPASKPKANPDAASASSQSGYDSAKLRFVGACACIAAGLAVAGSVDRSTGGVLVLIGWIAGVATLHRLGRAGSKAA